MSTQLPSERARRKANFDTQTSLQAVQKSQVAFQREEIPAVPTLQVNDGRELSQSLTFYREGAYKWDVFRNSGSGQIQHTGPKEEVTVSQRGGETLEPPDPPGSEKKAVESAMIFTDDVVVVRFKGGQMKHPYTERTITIPNGTFMGQRPGFLVHGGQRKVGHITAAIGEFRIIGMDFFTYFPPSGGSKEVFLSTIKPEPVFQPHPSHTFQKKGDVYMQWHNHRTGRLLLTHDLSKYQGPEGAGIILPISYLVEQRYSAFVAPGDVIRVEIVH